MSHTPLKSRSRPASMRSYFFRARDLKRCVRARVSILYVRVGETHTPMPMSWNFLSRCVRGTTNTQKAHSFVVDILVAGDGCGGHAYCNMTFMSHTAAFNHLGLFSNLRQDSFVQAQWGSQYATPTNMSLRSPWMRCCWMTNARAWQRRLQNQILHRGQDFGDHVSYRLGLKHAPRLVLTQSKIGSILLGRGPWIVDVGWFMKCRNQRLEHGFQVSCLCWADRAEAQTLSDWFV